jgi:hypothetical protein
MLTIEFDEMGIETAFSQLYPKSLMIWQDDVKNLK